MMMMMKMAIMMTMIWWWQDNDDDAVSDDDDNEYEINQINADNNYGNVDNIIIYAIITPYFHFFSMVL